MICAAPHLSQVHCSALQAMISSGVQDARELLRQMLPRAALFAAASLLEVVSGSGRACSRLRSLHGYAGFRSSNCSEGQRFSCAAILLNALQTKLLLQLQNLHFVMEIDCL